MKKKPLKILVTAVGGDLGQSIVKSLRISEHPMTIYGSDIESLCTGAFFVDKYFVLTLANNKRSYLKSLKDLVIKYNIDVIVPGSDPEIWLLSGFKPVLLNKAVIICQDREWIELYGDKLRCMQNLQDKIEIASFCDGLNISALDHFQRAHKFPLVIKSRKSSGSKSLRLAYNKQQLIDYVKDMPDPLVQTYIEGEEDEFSVGLFSCRRFTSSIVLRRNFGPLRGISWYAETKQDPDVRSYANQIAKITKLKGSANIQVRKSSDGVRLLEINPRFSSLVAARAVCGFRDVEWSIYQALNINYSIPKENYPQIKFQRFLQEMVDFGEGYKMIYEWNPKIEVIG